MPKYEIKIAFNTSRPLTSEEQFLLAGACQVQVEEPVDGEGEKMEVKVTEVNSRIIEAPAIHFDLKKQMNISYFDR